MTAPSLTDFLLARIAEDEEAARQVPRAPWDASAIGEALGYDKEWVVDSPDRLIAGNIGIFEDPAAEPLAQWIARHDPARVLAECEAKRRIVEMVEQKRLRNSITTSWVEALMALAAPYADHPDCRQEWAL